MTRLNPKLIPLFVALLSIASAAAQSVPTVKEGQVTGAGFVITLPTDIVVEPAGTNESTHGFYLDLPPRSGNAPIRREGHDSSYRYIAFDTKWDIGDMPSLDKVVDSLTSNILEHIPPEIVGEGPVMLEANLPARLGTLPARRLIIKYRNSQKKPAIRQIIVGYHARKDAAAIIYFLTLNTTQQNFQDDIGLFSKILSGFKLTDQ